MRPYWKRYPRAAALLFLGVLWLSKARAVEAEVAAPPNDACAAAAGITAVPSTIALLTSAATTEPGDPTPSCGNGSSAKSVWYRFTSPTSGTIEADTFDSDYDTILSTYAGTCGNLHPIPNMCLGGSSAGQACGSDRECPNGKCNLGCNDDDPLDGAQSKVSLQAAAGTTYYFMVSASNDDGGSLAFHLMSLSAASAATPTSTATPGPEPSATLAVGHVAPVGRRAPVTSMIIGLLALGALVALALMIRRSSRRLRGRSGN